MAAYANVSKSMAEAGQDLGKGIGTAVAAYIESSKKADTLKGTFNSLAPRVKTAIDRIDKQLAAVDPEVASMAKDDANTSDDVVVFRALSRAREDLVSGIGKFEDMSNSKKEQWLGSAANLIKFAEDKEEQDYKRGRDAAADNAATLAAQAERDKEARLKAEADRKATAEAVPAGLANAFNRAVAQGRVTSKDQADQRRRNSEQIIALEGQKATEQDIKKKQEIQDQINALTQWNSQVLDDEQKTLQFVAEQTAKSTINSPETAGTFLQILKDQRKALLGGVPNLLAKFEDGTAVSFDEKGNMKGFTLDAKTLEAIPAPVRKELEYLQADIVALEQSLSPKKDEAGKPIKDAEFSFVPPSAALRAEAIVRRGRAQNAYAAQANAFGYSPSPVELDWVADLAEYEGTVTDDGYKIEIDAKTGKISATKDPQWVAFNAKNVLLLTAEEADQHAKRLQELNIIQFKNNARAFGTALPNGEQKPRRWVFDSMFGINNVYIRGEAAVDDTRATEIHKKIRMTNDEMGALASIVRIIAQKDEKGAVIMKKDADGKPVMVRGQPVPEVQKMSELPDPDRRALAIGIANFIRIRAEKLGVLSAQDWAYLDTLVPQISSQFVENIKAGQSVSSLMPKILDYVITGQTIDSRSIISNAITLMADARTALTNELKNTPARGTATGTLEVTSGLARLEDGKPMRYEQLDRWYDIAVTSDYDTQNETNDLQTEHAKLKIAYESRKASAAATEAFREQRKAYRAFLHSRGMDAEQVDQILKRYFAHND